MKLIYRTLTMLAASIVLGVTSAALATAAHADVDVDPLGGVVAAHANSTIDASVLGKLLVTLPDPAAGVV